METIKETKDVLKFVVSGYKVWSAAKADGKIDLGDIGHLMLMVPHIQPAFEGVDKIPAEFKDLSAAEAQEIAEYIVKEFSVGDEKVAEIVNASLGLIISGYKLYLAINKKADAVA